jgi:hypothetical protein
MLEQVVVSQNLQVLVMVSAVGASFFTQKGKRPILQKRSRTCVQKCTSSCRITRLILFLKVVYRGCL